MPTIPEGDRDELEISIPNDLPSLLSPNEEHSKGKYDNPIPS
jgi:hypothetical protein